MPQVVDIVDGLLGAAADATDRQENRRLKKHVEAVAILKDDALSDVQKLEKLIAISYLPHYEHATDATVSGSVSASALRRKAVEAGGEAGFGPVKLIGQLVTETETREASSVQFSINLERRLIGGLVAEILAAGDSLT